MMDKQYLHSPYLSMKYKTKDNCILLDYFTNKMVRIHIQDFRLLSQFSRNNHLSVHDYSSVFIHRMLQKQWLFQRDLFSLGHRLRRAEIETTTLCNWTCRYCPSAYHKRKPKIMGMELFKRTLDLCTRYPTIDTVCIHAYCEPTIDPFFTQRVKMIRDYGYHFELFTNGSHLSWDKIKLLSECGNTKKIVFNFPSADENKFYQLTGSKMHKQIIENIQLAISYGLPVFITVLSKDEQKDFEIYKLFENAYIDNRKIHDRASTLPDENYNCNIYIEDEFLYGCFYFSQILYVNSDGDVLPCINDFIQPRYVLGNINQINSIDELMESAEVRRIREKIFGLCSAENDFICRRCIYMKKNKMDYYTTWNEMETYEL